MAPSKRRKTSAVSQPASGNASSGVRTRRSASARGDLPDAPDADLDAEPEELMCPITRTMFRDPVFVVDSGHTYERSAILSHFERNGAKDPLTRRALSSTKVTTIWAMRNVVQAWLDKHPDVTPDGWDSRELLEPSKDDGTRSFDDEGDVGVLRTWRAMCPELQERWLEDEHPEDWVGVTMENGRVVELYLEGFDLTGAVPAEIGRLSALRELNLGDNRADELAGGDRAAHVAAGLVPHRQSADERAGGYRAAHVADEVVAQPQSADELAGGDRAAHGADEVEPWRQSADELAGGDRAAHVAEGLYLGTMSCRACRRRFGQLTALEHVGPQRQSADDVAGCDTRAQSGGLQCAHR